MGFTLTHRSSAEEYEVRLLLFTTQRGGHLPASSLAPGRVLQVSYSPRVWLTTLCAPHHREGQWPRYGSDIANPFSVALLMSDYIYVFASAMLNSFVVWSGFLLEFRAVALINPGRVGFEELRIHFLTEKEQQQKERLLNDYLILMEIPVIGLGYDPTQIIRAARYERVRFVYGNHWWFPPSYILSQHLTWMYHWPVKHCLQKVECISTCVCF